ncbi:MAG: 3-deoxy-manno-octulosonate cytidylyltransferase [Candidatus Omnitrophica bacterium]|nr:3-deoxy-manno-octulosonate cytidylyltransferase [Candidatus Omnitrophota bacterium]MCC6732283.1 3-deoxy-manno-octulosonate cytidylyltransferase [Candidatus Omnitrophota bacterium]MCK6496714.1 3-deoxy-manno-octulosonate cytidylyltransferase [bacterium]MCL4735153.1 3-deoxy-manno-octulosonate cytidylyltransferase [Candidatus Omnitrophota bacterium]NUP94313.1 3-deoxy-manno-octulosonate cytidylyltransferase [Candidatus Omnitrophota bacterium]
MSVWCFIPARFESTRLPGKPLIELAGKPMIQWVVEKVCKATLVDRVVVATDHPRIVEVVHSFGGEAVLTSPEHPSGTDRIYEALGKGSPDVVINVQGDEPLIDPGTIDQIAGLFTEGEKPQMATLCHPLDPEEALDQAKVKVVCDNKGNALYFSRAPIPYPRDGTDSDYFLHIGIYAYTPETLRTFVALPQGRLEKLEKLEQLRALENGIPIRVATTPYRSFGVDTPQDAQVVDRILREQKP